MLRQISEPSGHAVLIRIEPSGDARERGRRRRWTTRVDLPAQVAPEKRLLRQAIDQVHPQPVDEDEHQILRRANLVHELPRGWR